MQIREFVTWEETVLPTWRSNHPDIVAPNESIWTQFPNDLMWYSALIEADDINKLCLIGSLDWLEVFQTFRLSELCQNFASALQSNDKYKHIDRIKALQSFYTTGKTLAPLIVIAPDCEGPYILVDGNHRASALLLNEMLIGQAVLIGTSKKIPGHVEFYQHSVTM